ncbi:LysR substrate binding domain protein [compost metagenome]
MIKQAVKTNMGIAFLPYGAVHREVTDGELAVKTLSSLKFKRQNGFIIRRNTTLSDAEQSFLKEAKGYFETKQVAL